MFSIQRVRVALDVPLNRFFDYGVPAHLSVSDKDIGRLVQVPFSNRVRIAVIVDLPQESEVKPENLKFIEALLDTIPALPADWLRLCKFCADYYQYPAGEVMLSSLPAGLKRLNPPKARKLREKKSAHTVDTPPPLTEEQAHVLADIEFSSDQSHPYLLHGITGSGKTEVYLRLIEKMLAQGKQTLLMVPEINLTPQLEARLLQRFPDCGLVSLHSGLTEAARLRHWKAAFAGKARIVLGTRLSVFTPLPDLGLIIIDEEHDPSFKQQDGIRYSARDLAVYRAHEAHIPIILGSATPSLESWANANGLRPQNRYRLLELKQRAVRSATLPAIQRIDTRLEKLADGLSGKLVESIGKRLHRGEQSLVFLNRRGYAPVLACPACGWISRCERCAANRVLHLADRRLRCHHCGHESAIPKFCPTCGNQDIQGFGRGTQRLEESLAAYFPQARILRVDRDSTRSRQQWQQMAEQIHAGEVDILIGTQMLAKGHDFPALTLVGVIGADAALFAADWRAPERLFAQLMQVAGRAGRAERPGEVLIQTQFPDHPLYAALVAHDYAAFAESLLKEREQAGFPPYAFQAILRAEAPQMQDALAFLREASAWEGVAAHEQVTLYDAVPMRLARRANLERAQLLVESASRRHLQMFLRQWREKLDTLRTPSRLCWHLEVDPIEI